MTHDITELAMVMAIAAHEACGQVRKHSGKPYWTHCQDVVALASRYMPESWRDGTEDDIIAAAWLHDTVEDTKLNLRTIARLTSQDIADLVDNLTKVEGDEVATLEKITRSSKSMFVKYCDIIANLQDCIKEAEENPKFAARFAQKKIEQLLAMHQFVISDPSNHFLKNIELIATAKMQELTDIVLSLSDKKDVKL